ncbi:MAG: hypothetical protein KJ955_08565 [Nanoarchaeota archaeon]|nr:hypothetical protein [Nanoarchaeota archaeon]
MGRKRPSAILLFFGFSGKCSIILEKFHNLRKNAGFFVESYIKNGSMNEVYGCRTQKTIYK